MITTLAPPRDFASVREHGSSTARRVPNAILVGAILLSTVLFVNDAVFRTNDAEKFNFDAQVALRLVVTALCGLYGLIHLRESIPTLTRGAGLLVLAFGCWAVAVVPFSVAWQHGLAASGSLWCAILFAAAVKNQMPPKWIAWSTVVSLQVFLVGSWIVYLFVPGMGKEVQDVGGGVILVRFGGLQHPNGLGSVAALVYGVMLAMAIEGIARWRTLIPLLAFAAITAVATDSRTSILAIGVLSVIALLRLQPFAKAAVALFVIVPFLIAVFGFAAATDAIPVNTDKIVSKLSRDGDANELYSMNSRTVVWDFALEKIFESPWVGCGYGCQRFIMKDNFFATHHAHNLLLNLALGMGYLGAGLFVLQILVMARRFFGGRNAFCSLVLVAVLLEGFAEGSMFGPTPDSHTILWLLAVMTPIGWSQSSPRKGNFSPELACQLN